MTRLSPATARGQRIRDPRTRLALALLMASTALSPAALLAQELPSGGSVASGQATITQPGAGNLNINQSSNSAVVNWNSFSVGQGGRVNFNQPSTNASTLNRVTGPLPSRIDGTISAPGSVYLVNRSGIVVGPTGRVDSRGFIASTLDISDEDYNAGRLRFNGNGASATVENHGEIALRQGGYAALLGGKVVNTGTITAPLGRVGIGAGERATLDLTGDGFLQIALPSDSLDGTLIEQAGRISAAGGRIEISAAAARDAARRVVNLSGVTEARSVSGRNGAIVLGGSGGAVRVTGRVDVSAPSALLVDSSPRPAARGGEITITARDIELEGATLLADGPGGGGALRIGGDFYGAGDLPHAETVRVDSDTSITIDATENGDGGTLAVWSDLATEFDGHVTARGGPEGGDGGFVEISSEDRLRYWGTTIVGAPEGDPGTLLLDPSDINICLASRGCVFGTLDVPIESILATLDDPGSPGSVFLNTFDGNEDPGHITVQDSISWSSSETLSLDADASIALYNPRFGEIVEINAPNGEFRLNATSEGANNPIQAFANINVGRLRITGGEFRQQAGRAETVTFASSGGVTAGYTLGTLPTLQATDLSMSPFAALTRTIAGDGIDAPFQIADIYGLQGVGSGPNSDAAYLLANNIANGGETAQWNEVEGDLEGWLPIGRGIAPDFSGIFDGNGFTVTGLTSRFSQGGMFGATSQASIRDLTLADIDIGITSGGSTGGLIADSADTSLSNITVTGTLSGDGITDDVTVGGIAGTLSDGAEASTNISALQFDGAIDLSDLSDATATVGGIAGSLDMNVAFGSSVDDTDATNIGVDLPSISITGDGNAVVGGLYGIVNVDVGEGTSPNDFAEGGTPNTILSGSNSAVDLNVDLADGNGTTDNEGGSDSNVIAGGAIGWLQRGTVALGTVESPMNIVAGPGTITEGEELSTSRVGGIIGFLQEGWLISGNSLGAAVDVGTRGRHEATVGGVVGQVGGEGFISPFFTPFSHDVDVSLISVGDNIVGGIAGVNVGVIDGQDVSGEVFVSSANTTANPDPTAIVGGAFGLNTGSVFISRSAVNTRLQGIRGLVAGGFAGRNSGLIAQTSAVGSTTVSGGTSTILGGHTGSNFDGTIIDSYSTGPVIALSSTAGTVGGFVGSEFVTPSLPLFTIRRSYSTSPITTNAGIDTVGGLVGTAGGVVTITESFWDPAATGVGARVGLSFPEGTPLTTAQFQDTLGFQTSNATTWDFFGTWAPGAEGIYPQLYRIDPVIYAFPTVEPEITVVYGQQGTAPDSGTLRGGPPAQAGSAGFQFGSPGDTISQAVVFADFFPDDFPGTPVGTSTVSGSGTGTSTGGQLYTVIYNPTDVTVTPAPLTIAAQDVEKVYGVNLTLDPANVDVTGLIDGDTIDEGYTLSSFGAPGTAFVGTYDITVEAVDGAEGDINNYELTLESGTLTVNEAPLTIRSLGQTKVYGDADFVLDQGAFDAVGLLNGDTPDVTLSSDGEPVTAVVDDYDIAIQVNFDEGDPLLNYDIELDFGTLSVTEAPLTINLTNQTKQYGTPDFELDTTAFTADGLLNEDTVTSVTIDSDGVPVTAVVADYAITGTGADGDGTGNYDIVFDPGTLSVTEAPLTIFASNQVKEYAQPGFALDQTAFTTSGLLNDDAVTSLALSSDGEPLLAPVGAYSIDIDIESVLGDGLANYDIGLESGTLTVSAAPLLIITPDDRSKVYGDPTFALGTTAFEAVGLRNDDSVTSVQLDSLGAAVTAIVGDYDITASEADGSGLSNYTISYDTGTLTVTQAPLTITASNQSKEYGQPGFVLDQSAFTVDGLLNQDTVDSVTLVSLGEPELAPVGLYDIDITERTGTGLGNYEIELQSGILNVGAAPLLVVTPGDQTKVYGDPAFALDQTAFTVDGLRNNDTVTSVDLASDGEAVGADAGDYAITGSNAQGDNLVNYVITYQEGTLTVTPAPLTITATNQTKSYQQPGFDLGTTGFTADGLRAGDTVTAVALSSPGADEGAPVGTYTITPSDPQGLTTGNYVIAFIDGVLTVGGLPLTVTALDQAKIYGELGFDLAADAFSVSGLQPGDQVSSVALQSPGEDVSAGAGTYGITPGDAQGSGLDNYTISYVDGRLTVTQADLTLTALDAEKVYGEPGFALDSDRFTVDGLRNDDAVSEVLLSSPGELVSAGVGSYTITPSAIRGDGLGNYIITIIDGTLSVSAAPLTVTPGTQVKTYGEDGFTLDASLFEVDGLRNSDSVDDLTAASVGSDAGATPGDYTLTVSGVTGEGLENYDLALDDGTLTVENAPLRILVGDQQKIYGEPGFTLDVERFSVTGLVNGDTVTGVTLSSDGAPTSAPVGIYPIVADEFTGTGLEFYDISPQPGELLINPADLTITALDQSRRVTEDFAFTGTEFSVLGLRAGDTIDAVTLFSEGALADATTDLSPYTITASDAVGTGLVVGGIDNYTISYVDGLFTVRSGTIPGAPGDPDVGVIVPPRLPGLFNPSDTVETPDGSVFTVITDPLAFAAFGGGSGTGLGFPTGPIPVAAPAVQSGGDGTGGGSATVAPADATAAAGGTASEGAAASSAQSIQVAESVLLQIDQASQSLRETTQECRETEGQVTDFLGCVSEALESYSASLDPANLDLPQELASISSTINQARLSIDGAIARANSQLAGVTDPVARRQIEQQAIADARAALSIASEEVSKTLTLIQADDPALAGAYRAQVETVLAAVNSVDLELQTVAGL